MRTALGLIATIALLAACSGSTPAPSTVLVSPAASSAVHGSAAASGGASSSSAASPSQAAASSTARADPLATVTHSMDDLKATRLQAEIQVGGHPDWQTALDGAVWVATGELSVARVDQSTNKIVTQIDADHPCDSLAAGFGAVWSPSCGTNELDRIDPRSNKVTARIPVAGIPSDGEGQLAVGGKFVWLFTDAEGSLAQVDPKSNRVVATHPTGVPGVALVEANGSLWASLPSRDAVAQIGLDGTVKRTIDVGAGPRFIAAGEGGVWVLGQGAGDVTRIDPETGTVVATIPLEIPGDGGCIITGGGSVWVTMPDTPISRIDPKTNAVTERFTGEGGDCIGFTDGSVWLSNGRLGNVWRFRP
jgi:streptogramin lyase